MNLITEFFVRNMVGVYFFYGLAFFTMGLALILASRRSSTFRFVLAIVPLALFGFFHGAHEWIEMFQRITAETDNVMPTLTEEMIRVIVLVISFALLMLFAVTLPVSTPARQWRIFMLVGGMVLLWGVSVVAAAIFYGLDAPDTISVADVLARYILAVPAALMATWALMHQQRTFREHDMPQFGRDLVWSAAALLLYGSFGQIFVRETVLPPSQILNNANFLLWFGIPVQLFRAAMAVILTISLLHALPRAFELEDQRHLDETNREKQAALEAERLSNQQMELLNEELRLAALKLSVLLDISNVLNTYVDLKERLVQALDQILDTLVFADAGLILLAQHEDQGTQMSVSAGFPNPNETTGTKKQPSTETTLAPVREADLQSSALTLVQRSIEKATAVCLHHDGHVIEFTIEEALRRRQCQRHASPTQIISFPLMSSMHVIGGLGLIHQMSDGQYLTTADLTLMVGIAQQLGVSIDNALLHQEAHEREKTLGNLLNQVVNAQEAERQRIARDLHDATSQSLTAVALGLRGIETQLSQNPSVDNSSNLVQQLHELQTFGADALRELRQIIADLRPPQLDDLGLVAAMRWYVKAFEQRLSIFARFIATGDEDFLPPEYKIVLFRIMQEALTNTAKHAQATQVEIELRIMSDGVSLMVTDNGLGFDPAQLAQGETIESGWGLVGIRERTALLGGHYQIDTAPRKGFVIRVYVPISFDANEPAHSMESKAWQKD